MDNNSTESTFGIRLQAWLEVNKKKLIIGVLGLGVAIFAGVMIFNYQAEKEARASQALSNIRLPISPAQPVPPGAAEQLLKVAQEFSGTMAAPRALLMSAGIVFTEGNYAEAEKRFARVLQEFVLDGLRRNALGHEIVAPIAQDTDNFGRERLIQDAADLLRVGAVVGCHGTVVHMCAGAIAQRLDIGQERLGDRFGFRACGILDVGGGHRSSFGWRFSAWGGHCARLA